MSQFAIGMRWQVRDVIDTAVEGLSLEHLRGGSASDSCGFLSGEAAFGCDGKDSLAIRVPEDVVAAPVGHAGMEPDVCALARADARGVVVQ